MKNDPKGSPPAGCIRLPNGALLTPRLEQDQTGSWKVSDAEQIEELRNPVKEIQKKER